jgi:RNA polymerase sigma-70 factor (ECF subfamily)
MRFNARPLADERRDREAGEADDAVGLGAVDDAPEVVCLEALYRKESPRLLRSLARRTANREEARDLLHDIFVRIVRLGATRPLRLERAEAYLSRAASNVLRDRAKSALHKSTRNSVSADLVSLAGPDQQVLLESRDMLSRLEAAMLKLRPRTREIFMAHRLDGLSYAEIAERTGLTIKGVEKQMSKAIAQIDRMLDRD